MVVGSMCAARRVQEARRLPPFPSRPSSGGLQNTTPGALGSPLPMRPGRSHCVATHHTFGGRLRRCVRLTTEHPSSLVCSLSYARANFLTLNESTLHAARARRFEERSMMPRGNDKSDGARGVHGVHSSTETGCGGTSSRASASPWPTCCTKRCSCPCRRHTTGS